MNVRCQLWCLDMTIVNIYVETKSNIWRYISLFMLEKPSPPQADALQTMYVYKKNYLQIIVQSLTVINSYK